MGGLFSIASIENQIEGIPKNDGRPKEKSKDEYNIYNLIDYLQEFDDESIEKEAGNLLQQFMALELREEFSRKILWNLDASKT